MGGFQFRFETFQRFAGKKSFPLPPASTGAWSDAGGAGMRAEAPGGAASATTASERRGEVMTAVEFAGHSDEPVCRLKLAHHPARDDHRFADSARSATGSRRAAARRLLGDDPPNSLRAPSARATWRQRASPSAAPVCGAADLPSHGAGRGAPSLALRTPSRDGGIFRSA